MFGSSAPQPPDPVKTATAQSALNSQTAITQGIINRTNQYTPYGNLIYQNIGTEQVRDPLNNRWIEVPRYRADVQLSPAEQRKLGQQQELERRLNDLALGQTSRITEHLGRPVDLSNEATEARLMELGRRRLDPIYNEREDALRNRLANQGLAPGSEAYDRAFRNEVQGRNDALTQLLLTGRAQAVNEALTERNQPLNEISALMSGGQVNQPNFVNTPQTPVAGTDYAGLVQDNYRAQLANWQNQQRQQAGLLGGLFDLGSAAIGGWAMSDRRVKEDIKKVGKLDDGSAIYKFKYKGSPLQQIGVMAQELEAKSPDLVTEVDGVKMVNYEGLAEKL